MGKESFQDGRPAGWGHGRTFFLLKAMIMKPGHGPRLMVCSHWNTTCLLSFLVSNRKLPTLLHSHLGKSGDSLRWASLRALHFSCFSSSLKAASGEGPCRHVSQHPRSVAFPAVMGGGIAPLTTTSRKSGFENLF